MTMVIIIKHTALFEFRLVGEIFLLLFFFIFHCRARTAIENIAYRVILLYIVLYVRRVHN